MTPKIRSQPLPNCPMCDGKGQRTSTPQRDDLFGAPGEWTFSVCTTPGCGLLWLNPAPITDDLHLAYQGYHTHVSPPDLPGWRRRIEGFLERACLQQMLGYPQGLSPGVAFLSRVLAVLAPAGTDAFLAKAMWLSPSSRSSKLLDIGCGNGGIMVRIRDLGWDPVGLDFDSQALVMAKAKGLEVFEGGTSALKDLDGPFEAITLNHVIEHLPNATEVLKECVRLLELGGRLVLVTPNTASMGSRIFGQDWRGLEPPRHLCIYNLRNLIGLAEQAGLKVESARSTARGARYILGQSLGLWWMRRRGRSGLPALGIFMHLVSLALQILERILLLVSPSSGEEIILIGYKDWVSTTEVE